ncbi:SDR family NAD(P)-dependent oxidoreductase [Marimonas arenosa]|uniref:SDR family NAD(P)-dependent oxidoreductase n=1 Tax=Marimonas arenosa TaxID=1795305 RepID=A0AAE3WGD6_9RHOB|nr:SDR family NAD(P)-dependent oxidoreductase [Marimonas arenosa]MDQ2091277.1 SDR family NAD(P)-dependent oxidoreductase [Marimonas arenosa]
MSENTVCAILGAGPGNGAACARRFAAAGYTTALCARDVARLDALAADIDGARPFSCDITDPASLASALGAIRTELGPITTLIFNAGASHWGGIDDLDDTALEQDFTLHALGLFRAVQAVLPDMRAAGHGTIIVIGAGAALRGRPASISVAAAKAAQRSIAQSLARQLGPENIHVSYLVLDGIVDLDRAKHRFPDKPDAFFLTAAGVADAAFLLSQQDRQAWSFELDLRPFGETW